jgi:tRNA uridine 5-carboxymethylaminomethyl modification enzyme
MDQYDVIVIGGGHAGTEAAAMAARRGARTLLLTQNLDTVGQMSCNPAIGGVAKGTIVREVDALGGIMGRATDLACIQFRMLNRSKGPAVWSPRAQCDRTLYRRAVRALLERLPLLDLRQGTAAKLSVTRNGLDGVITVDGIIYGARALVLTTGTFLRGRIHQGLEASIPAGRAGEAPALEIAEALEAAGLQTRRFKTGTPPRIDGRTVNFAAMQIQTGDPDPFWFSFYHKAAKPEQRPCYLTYTGDRLREIVRQHLSRSALYGGAISGRGPRYCPSIEDKVVKFPDAKRHQVFLEPEGLDTSEMYVNGLSTSLPPNVQLDFLRSVPGLEQVRMTRSGYAIEYDYFPPEQLRPTLETRAIGGLYLAGQVNGTTGYEEAAAQGVVAGLNAAGHALGEEQVVVGRDQAYIGVLIDDLVSRGVDEPYRLFTSRSEYRLLLRQDNALRRLYQMAQRLGLLSDEEQCVAEGRLAAENEILALATVTPIDPERVNSLLGSKGSTQIRDSMRLADLARRPEVPLYELLDAAEIRYRKEDTDWANIECKYWGYLVRERAAAERISQMDGFRLPDGFDYRRVQAMSFEAREKLQAIQPESLGLASRIPGVSPSDLQNLVVEVLKHRGSSPDGVSRET